MGTRADFYLKNEQGLKWLGSVHWDGYDVAEARQTDKYPTPFNVLSASREDEFINSLEEYFKKRDDVRRPEHGWPWPWENSKTTDMSYVFQDNKCQVYSWGQPVEVCEDEDGGFDYKELDEPQISWPDMSEAANVTDAGFIVISV